MSLNKIGKATTLAKALDSFKLGGSISDTISSLRAFGNVNDAAKYLAKNRGSLPDATSIWMLQQAYTPYGNVNKILHFILDGEDLGTVETQSSGRIMSYNIPKQEHGSHLLKVYMTATINNKEITSNTICKDIICVDPTNRTPIIGCAQQEFTAQQYQATSIKYVVYDPDHNPASVKLSIDGKVQSTLSVNRSAQIWSYKSSTEGKHNLTISCRKVTKILSVNITKLDIDVEPITANLAFDFNPVGKSNGDTDRLWTDKNNSAITLSVSDNFDWDNGGYQIDASGNQYFCVKAGTTAQINYNLFEKDPKQTGSEFKFVFKTQNVRNASATFLSCIDGTEGSDVGIKMDVHEAYVNTSTDSLYFPYSEEDIIEFEYNINTIDTKDTSATSIIMTYEDGVGGRPLIYDNSHRLHQYSPTPISIGSPDCDVLIYRMKAYSASLTDSDILAIAWVTIDNTLEYVKGDKQITDVKCIGSNLMFFSGDKLLFSYDISMTDEDKDHIIEEVKKTIGLDNYVKSSELSTLLDNIIGNLEDKSTVVDYINSLSYNKLFDVPIVNLIGTLTVPVKISSLDDGIYKVKGQCIIGGNNTTVQSSADDVLYLVSHDADTSSTTITKMQGKSITLYFIQQDGEYMTDRYVTESWINEQNFASADSVKEYVSNIIEETVLDVLDEHIDAALDRKLGSIDSEDLTNIFQGGN